MSSRDGPKPGKTYRCVVNAIGAKFADVNIPPLGVKLESRQIVEQNNEVWPIISIESAAEDLTLELLYVRMEMFITGLSIGTITNCWLSDYIYDEDGTEVWRNPGTLGMIVEKEGDPLVKEDTGSSQVALMVDVSFHIVNFYPKVSLYHHLGLFLLRTPLVGYTLNGEILLNFFKIGELVTATRTGRKPRLRDINKQTNQLRLGYDESEVTEFWKVRSRDAAHDYDQAEFVSRESAVDCKLWAEEMIMKD